MDESQIELYLATLTFAALDRRELSPEEQRYVERMRERYPAQCSELDAEVDRDLRQSPRYQRMVAERAQAAG